MPIIPQEVLILTASGDSLHNCMEKINGKLKTTLEATSLGWRLIGPIQTIPPSGNVLWTMVATLTKH